MLDFERFLVIRLHAGDCRVILKTLDADSVDACVTDPPYELTSARPGGRSEATRGAVMGGFMGLAWDATGVAFDPATWREVFRVLKPGAHLLAFGGTRTHHRLIVAIEDAGFEIRDCLGWLYGSGFPKSHNLDGEFDGWGTALKPAWEPVCLARKPFRGTVAENVARHGVGAVNIDGCRVLAEKMEPNTGRGAVPARHGADAPREPGKVSQPSDLGRWPANILHDGSDEVVALFPNDAGAAAPVHARNGDKFRNSFGDFSGNIDEAGSTFHGDAGSAARFFYCAKTSPAERDDGLAHLDPVAFARSTGAQSAVAAGAEYQTETGGGYNRVQRVRNTHPTVKPTDLMAYLCRLVTPPGGTVLDPFCGSGSTGRGAVREQFHFVGIDLDPQNIAIAEARIHAAAPLFARAAE